MPSINKPTRFGHIFEGYYTETEGDEAQYFNADEKSARDYDIAPNTTLYAFWQKARFTVSFDLNYEGSGSPPAARTAAGGGSITLPAVPGRMGYDFIGWYTYPEGGAKAGDAGAPYTPSQAASPSTRGGSRVTLIFISLPPGAVTGTLWETHWSNPSVGGASLTLVLSGSIGGPAICASGWSLTITWTGYLNAVTPPAGPPGGHWRRPRRGFGECPHRRRQPRQSRGNLGPRLWRGPRHQPRWGWRLRRLHRA
ncbi:MAG: InlB B-repeat-containing protein [Treponematales bacterium]